MEYIHKKYLELSGLLLLFLFAGNSSIAQHQLFLELGGFSKTYSVNFALQLQNNYQQQSFIRIGGAIEENRLLLPIGFIFIKGNRSHFWEVSGGFMLWSEGYQFWIRDRSDILLTLNTGIAYRYQPFRGNYFISFGLFPFLRLDPSPNGIKSTGIASGFRPGFSLGYRIK